MLKQKFTHEIYTCFDKISKKYIGTFIHYNDKDMIRQSLPTILYQFPLRDVEVICIGSFSEISGKIEPSNHRKVKLDSYTFPHSRLSSVGDDLSLDELASGITKEKSDFIASLDKSDDNINKDVQEA